MSAASKRTGRGSTRPPRAATPTGRSVTGRLGATAGEGVHDGDEVGGVRLSGRRGPEPAEVAIGDGGGADEGGPSDAEDRRPRTDTATGRGSIVAVVDWWFDIPDA